MGADDEWLGVGIADDTYAFVPLHLVDIVLELGAELRVLDIVDETGKTLPVQYGKATSFGTKVGMIVRSVEQILDTVRVSRNSEHSTHRSNLLETDLWVGRIKKGDDKSNNGTEDRSTDVTRMHSTV
jgi:hypothetical protein